MSNFWIFIVRDHKWGKRLLLSQTVLENRFCHRFWALNPRAPYAKRLEEGDRVLFYASGEYPLGFAGCGTLTTKPHDLKPEQAREVLGAPSRDFTHAVDFTLDERFALPRLLKEVLAHVRPKGVIGTRNPYFRGSIQQLSKKEYDTIVSLCKSGATQPSSPV